MTEVRDRPVSIHIFPNRLWYGMSFVEDLFHLELAAEEKSRTMASSDYRATSFRPCMYSVFEFICFASAQHVCRHCFVVVARCRQRYTERRIVHLPQ